MIGPKFEEETADGYHADASTTEAKFTVKRF
jgi:hypothetical protein